MLCEAISHGLKTRPNRSLAKDLLMPSISMMILWRVLEYLPVPHLSCEDRSSIVWWRVFHFVLYLCCTEAMCGLSSWRLLQASSTTPSSDTGQSNNSWICGQTHEIWWIRAKSFRPPWQRSQWAKLTKTSWRSSMHCYWHQHYAVAGVTTPENQSVNWVTYCTFNMRPASEDMQCIFLSIITNQVQRPIAYNNQSVDMG